MKKSFNLRFAKENKSFWIKKLDDEIEKWCELNTPSYKIIAKLDRLNLYGIMFNRNDATIFKLFWNDIIDDDMTR